MTKELIAEARAWAPCAMSPTGQLKLITRLADALEAATRVPVQGEPNDDREALARVLYIASDDFAFADRMAKAWDAPGAHGRQRWYRYADAILTAGFSRAVVPDAATEAKNAWHLAADVWQARALKVEAERDAALAAVERVRAIHPNVNGECHTCSDENGPKRWPCDTLAALDGAPEPEWEYQWGEPGGSFEGFDSFATEDLARAEMELDSYYSSHRVMRRRKAGPWLPVEGERP